jgi:hypothetical protein
MKDDGWKSVTLGTTDDLVDALQSAGIEGLQWGKRSAETGIFAPLNDPLGGLSTAGEVLTFVTILFTTATAVTEFSLKLRELLKQKQARAMLYGQAANRQPLTADASTSSERISQAVVDDSHPPA